MDVVAAVGADEEAAAVVQPGESSFDDPAVAAEPLAVLRLAAGDDRLDASLPDEAPVLVVVVATVGDQRPGSAPWATDTAVHGRHSVEQLKQLGDVVAIAARERPDARDAAAVYEQVVLATRAAAVESPTLDPGAEGRLRVALSP